MFKEDFSIPIILEKYIQIILQDINVCIIRQDNYHEVVFATWKAENCAHPHRPPLSISDCSKMLFTNQIHIYAI